MATIYQQIKHDSGIPLGGIGAGTMEIRPDGLFHEWQILNMGQWSPESPCDTSRDVSLTLKDLVFIVRTETSDGTITTRYLALSEDLHELYSFPWIKCVEGILFDGRFPVATLTFEDSELPVEIQAELFSPFIPNDSRNSGTPGFYANFVVRNLSHSPVSVSILASMRNIAGFGQKNRKPRNRVEIADGSTAIVLDADSLGKDSCSTGNMTLSAAGGDISHVAGTYKGEKHARFWKSRYGLKAYSYLHPFRETGRLPCLDADGVPTLPADFRAENLSPAERQEILQKMMTHSLVYDKYRRISQAHPDLAQNDQVLIEFLNDLAANFEELKDWEWGETALCSRLELDTQARQSTLFTVSWYFPNHLSPKGPRLGHMYENWFTDSLEVNRHLTSNFADFRKRTLLMPNLIYDSSLDFACADAVSGQLSTLTKGTWWTQTGHFGVWEGLGCCGFHTTDITYQGSFPIIALFPDLQKVQMTHGARFQREDGRVHHLFQPDFSCVDDDFDRVDMNPQFVMLAARDYFWTGDCEYLEGLWPHILRAMENYEELDTDGDGLPDRDTRRNTYDVWDLAGVPSYIGSLWLGALKAAVRLAKEMGDESRAERWQQTYDRGVTSFESKLWNGSYYILWKDESTDRQDECCMSDQLSGDWYCDIMGWGSICKPDRIRKALANIMRHNFQPDTGLINASYPPGVPQRLPTAGNMQAEATWTGIEYTVAALLIRYGMIGDGLSVVHDIHNRYLQAGRFWNHVECGNHYYRAMSSWTLLMALSGFQLDIPARRISFAPAVESDECRFPFFAPGIIGVYSQKVGMSESSARIEMLSGSLALDVLSIPRLPGIEAASLTLNSEPCNVKSRKTGTSIQYTFRETCNLNSGDVLVLG